MTANSGSAGLPASARDHLWLHFARHSTYAETEIPVIERGEGVYVYDTNGKRYLDGLAGLFAVQVGHGREELAQAAAAQTRKLAYFPLWSAAQRPKATRSSACSRAR